MRGIASICIFIFCLSSLQASAQTEFELKQLKQQHAAELDRWMLTAYEGDAEAQYKVATLYTDDRFSGADFEQSVYWYRQAARQGHVLAQYNLGHQYLLGVGVTKSESSAMKWWLEAAKQDHPLAQFNVGRAYYLGIGLEQDHKKSKYWFKRAANNEEPKSIEILVKLGWSEGEIDESVAPDLAKNPESNDALKKQQPFNSKSAAGPVAKTSTTPNPASQLAIKEARDRRATPDLKSKIIPIDLPEEGLADSDSGDGAKGGASEDSQETLAEANRLEAKESPEPIKNSELVDSTKPEKAPESKKSKLIIVENMSKPGNLKSDEQQINKAPLNKSITGELAKDLPKIGQQEISKVGIAQANKPAPLDKQIPIAIYTDPKARSVLIAIIDDRSELKLSKAGSKWSSVTSTKGIPVWMHGDYLKLDRALSGSNISASDEDSDSVLGTVTGDNVNTRSVPIVSPGTVVGRLNKGERLSVIEKRDEWYRVIAPKRFNAWVKTQDFNLQPPNAKPALQQIAKQAPNKATDKLDPARSDDKWLFEQKASDYTLQLGSFIGAAPTQEYLRQISFSQNSDMHQIVSQTEGSLRTVFLYGAYKNRKLADKTKSEIAQKQAWVRPLGGLQENRCNHWRQQEAASAKLKQYCK